MRSPRVVLATSIVLPAVLAGVTACTDSKGGAEAHGSSSAPAAPATTAPPLAGSAEAQAVAALPTGPATGTAVLAYSGVGEVREPFTGQCSDVGSATRIEGSADTARIRLDVAPEGAQVALDDTGLSATSILTTGRYVVAGNHLSLAAGLTQDGQTVGSVELEIDCG